MARSAGTKTQVTIEGRELTLSNLGKVLYPAAEFHKAEVLDYYTRVSATMLPHLHDRPMTLKRYPDGVDAEFFYEKECPRFHPDWVKTAAIWSRHNEKPVNYCLVQDLPTLIWLANLATLELHPLLSRQSDVKRPDFVAFDLDPGPPATIVECCRVAVWIRELFEALGLQSFPKTSGSKGLQVYVPLNSAVTYDDTKPFAHAVAQILEKQHPELVVSSMSKAIRGGRVLVDWSQNEEHKTTAAVYSLRARERPTVSTPVTWNEVEATQKSEDPATLRFEAADVLRRIDDRGDLFAPVLQLQQKLPQGI